MKKKILAIIVCIAIVLSATVLVFAIGGPDDPLISLSFIEGQLIPRIAGMIDARLSGIDITEPGAGYNRTFEVVDVLAGQRLMGYAGTEFIVRAGAANIIASELGGISDTTNGVDLENMMAAPLNHLLIVPRSDGRGLNVTAHTVVMVRGQYSIR